MPAIRLATPDDAPELARLRYEFRSSTDASTEAESDFVARCSAWMAPRLQAGSNWRCWALVGAAHEISGNLWLQLIEKVPNPSAELETHAYITNVFVRPPARGMGVGEALVNAALRFCREQHVDSVILWPTDRSRSLYARYGFAVRDDIMEAVLDAGRLH